jgi:hypothetical protein
MMKLNLFDRAVLALATMFLAILALRPLLTPEVALAQGVSNHLYFEPGITTIISLTKPRRHKARWWSTWQRETSGDFLREPKHLIRLTTLRHGRLLRRRCIWASSIWRECIARSREAGTILG